MTSSDWQVQDAKQHVSEVVRRAQDEEAQVVTRNGQEVAVVLAMAEPRQGIDRQQGPETGPGPERAVVPESSGGCRSQQWALRAW